MLLTDLLHPDCIQVPLVCKNKQDAIFQLIDTLAKQHHLTDAQQLKDAVWERENTRTTGMGFHIAIPHGKTSSCSKLIMGIADGSVTVDGNEIYTAKDLRVGLFKQTESF